MKQEEFFSLQEGDIIRHVNGSEGYIVHGNYLPGGVLVVRGLIIRNPAEWKLIQRAHQAKPSESWGTPEAEEKR